VGSTLQFDYQNPNFIIKQDTQCLLSETSLNKLSKDIKNHISRTPYPFVKGGFLYQGRSTSTTRAIYQEFLGNYPEVKEMISFTMKPSFLLDNFKNRVKRKFRFWFSS
jgi:hypothetical protein